MLCQFGDGAVETGSFHEALNLAAIWDLPIVFQIINNQYGMGTSVEQSSSEPDLWRRAAAYRMHGERIDGNDVLASFAVTRAALDQARNGQGPTLIEAYTYRMGAHTSSDDPTRYRIASEVESWKAKDPIARVKAFLAKQQLADDTFFAEVDEAAKTLALDLS